MAIAYCITSPVFAGDQHSAEKNIEKPRPAESSGINFERILENPNVTASLDTGTKALNQSIESIMESLFYQILDQDYRFRVTDTAKFGPELGRTVITSDSGQFVIIDSFRLSTEQLSSLFKLGNSGTNLNTGGGIGVLNIYSKTEAMRKTTDLDASLFQYLVSNWFGLLPLLTEVLPPSFNPLELHDPIATFEPATLLPLDYEKFAAMPLGNIRAFQYQGALLIPTEFLEERIDTNLGGLQLGRNLISTLPYTIIENAESIISVAKRTSTTAWVGLINKADSGHQLELSLGKTYLAFRNALPFWTGLKTLFLPIRSSYGNTARNQLQKLYSFDMTKMTARIAYEQAVKGDFTLSHLMYLKSTESGENTGVNYLFTRKKSAVKEETNHGSNWILANKSDKSLHSLSEVETTDASGRQYQRESLHRHTNAGWNTLVGDHRVEVEAKATVSINKFTREQTGEEFERFTEGEHTIIEFTNRIDDKYVDTTEYLNYLKNIERFLGISLSEYGQVPIFDSDEVKKKMSALESADPTEQIYHLHPTPAHLGKLFSVATFQLPLSSVLKISRYHPNVIAKALLKSFNIDKTHITKLDEQVSSFSILATTPFRLIGLTPWQSGLYWKIKQTVDQWPKLTPKTTPAEWTKQLHNLLDFPYLENLAHALRNLAGSDDLYKSVKFYTSSKNKDFAGSELFSALDGKEINTNSDNKTRKKWQEIEETIAKLSPTSVSGSHSGLSIKRFSLTASNTRESQTAVKVEFLLTSQEPLDSVKVHIKLEELGDLDFGRFVLVDQIFNASATKVSQSQYLVNVVFQEKSAKLLSILSKQLSLNGRYQIEASCSEDGKAWSPKKKEKFNYEQGELILIP